MYNINVYGPQYWLKEINVCGNKIDQTKCIDSSLFLEYNIFSHMGKDNDI